MSASERIAVRSLSQALGLTVPSGQENDHLLTLVERLQQAAENAGGPHPAPAVPEVLGMNEFRSSTGNDLLAELAARAEELKPLITQWQAAKTEKEFRLRDWNLATRLVSLGAAGQREGLDAIRTARNLLAEPNPLPALLSAAAEDLRNQTNTAHAAWKQAWHAGEARLKADPAWEKMSPEKKHQLRVEHALRLQEMPDLSTPEKIAESLSARGLSQWRDMAFAVPARVDAALRDAALELEPKTQTVAVPRRVIRTESGLDAWLGEIRDTIAPLLADGPVWPSA